MKKIVLLVAVVLMPKICLANTNIELPSKEELIKMIDKKYEIQTRDSKCKTLSELAKAIMEGRQNGLSFDYVYKTADEGSLPEDMKMKQRQIVLQAYEYPLYSSDEDKLKAIGTFHLKSFLECRNRGVEQDWDLR
nr:hypothetical protein [Acinetobacter oleivorans]